MARKAGLKTTVTEKGPGFSQLIAELAGAAVTIGVQGDEAKEKHSNSERTKGEVAAIHELGLGVPERSWLRSWFDANQNRIQQETRDALTKVAARKVSRKKAMEDLGYSWVEQIRDNIVSGKITPALSASTVARKGHNTPLLESSDMVNAITFKLFLKSVKAIQDPSLRAAVRAGPKK
jgi:hypothetical protein